MHYLTLVIMGLTNILVLGLFFFFIFKRKIAVTTYVEKVNFYSNLILLLMTLHYLNLITPYLSESLLFHSLTFLPAKIIPNLGALFFWVLLIYVVKKILLRRAQVTFVLNSSALTQIKSNNFKLIALTLLPVIALASYFLYPSIASKFSDKLKIKISCKDFYITNVFSVNSEKSEVIAVRKYYNQENDELVQSDIHKFDECIVVDSKNWSCGDRRKSSIFKSIDGIFAYEKGFEPSSMDSCTYKQLN